jgi:small subunit ribosomal protein S17
MSIMSAVTQKLASSTKMGVVISAGRMSKAVKVRLAGQEFNKQIKKV